MWFPEIQNSSLTSGNRLRDSYTVKPTVKVSLAHPGIGGKPELPYGAYSKIARRVRPVVTANHVREVFKGHRKSARIQAAIERFKKELAA